MNKEFFSIVSQFVFRSGRAKFELTRLFAILDEDEMKILDYKDLPLSVSFIENVQKKLEDFFSRNSIYYDCNPLIIQFNLLNEMLDRPLPALGQLTKAELASYEEVPNEALRLAEQYKEIILQFRAGLSESSACN